MTEEQKAAFIIAQAACAMARIAGMQAENVWCQSNGESLKYGEEAFAAIENEYMIGYNAVIGYFRS